MNDEQFIRTTQYTHNELKNGTPTKIKTLKILIPSDDDNINKVSG